MVADVLKRHLLSLGWEASLSVPRRGCNRAGHHQRQRTPAGGRCRRRHRIPLRTRTKCLEHHRPLLVEAAVVASAGLLLTRLRPLRQPLGCLMHRLASSSEGHLRRRCRPPTSRSGHPRLPHRRQTRAGIATIPRPGVRSTNPRHSLLRAHLRHLILDRTATFDLVHLSLPIPAGRGLGPTTRGCRRRSRRFPRSVDSPRRPRQGRPPRVASGSNLLQPMVLDRHHLPCLGHRRRTMLSECRRRRHRRVQVALAALLRQVVAALPPLRCLELLRPELSEPHLQQLVNLDRLRPRLPRLGDRRRECLERHHPGRVPRPAKPCQ